MVAVEPAAVLSSRLDCYTSLGAGYFFVASSIDADRLGPIIEARRSLAVSVDVVGGAAAVALSGESFS